ncbi:MAG: lysophospholipid acyltransferase family protein [Gemmatimonadaceae bacterium]
MNESARARSKAQRIAWSVRAGLLALRALASTWRINEVNGGVIRELRAARQPFILAFWHGRMLPLLWHHRGQGINILVSEHGDGEIIARIAEALGCRTIRGSTSRGAERALLGLIRTVRDGGEVAITPDGPRGPAESFAPGALVVAQRSGAPLVTLAAGASSTWRLKSWDGFMIPKPFARVTIAYGCPERFAELSAREAAAQAARMQSALVELTATTDV